jgi:hypothetical protein
VNGYHDNLRRNVLIGRRIRSAVRNVAARQSVTEPIAADTEGVTHLGAQDEAVAPFLTPCFDRLVNKELCSGGSKYEDFFMISSWTLHIREVGFT